MRPTVGVDQTSVSSGFAVAVGPHCHFTTGFKVAADGGWYSHEGTQPESAVPASSAQTTGSGRHCPLAAKAEEHPASSGGGGVPASPEPRLGSQ
jgi:hypothetical protein